MSFRTWSLRAKLSLISMAAVAITSGACLLIQRSIIRSQGIDLTRNAMRGVLLSAENVRESVSGMQQARVFDPQIFASRASGDYKDAALYRTIPIVSAWKSIEQVAQREDYQFHVAAHSPRNPKNLARPEEEDLLRRFEQNGESEFFEVDEDHGEIVYARPIRLSQDCLLCHGDPSTSPTHDGLDVVGLRMENWHVGQVHGAFVLRSRLSKLNPVIRAGVERTLIWILPMAALVGLGVYFLLGIVSRNISSVAHSLSRGAELVDRMVNQLSLASQCLAEGASRQAAAIEQTSASGVQIRASASEALQATQGVTGLMSQSEERYNQANLSLDRMVASMAEIGDQSRKIAQIIKVIDEIAFQTHMLALNASVEAARAGDAGLGFSVVATEVGNLASRCARAAEDTASMIEESIAKASDGRSKVSQLVDVIGAMTADCKQMRALVDYATARTHDQARGIDQISKAISQMEQVTQSNAAHAEESAATAKSLNSQSEHLRHVAQALNAIVHGTRR